MKIEDPREKALRDELEAIYQQVVREAKKSEADSKESDALQSHYETLQLPLEASPDEIKEAYEQLADSLNPDRFADNPSFREQAERKLAEITQAYEKIMAFRQRESQSIPAEPEPLIDIAEEEPDLLPAEQQSRPFWGSKTFLVLLTGIVFAVLIPAVCFWPAFQNPLYHYGTVKSGNKTYAVRTNRITGAMTYFGGGTWQDPPIPAPVPSAISPFPAAASTTPPPTSLAKQAVPVPAAKPEPGEKPAFSRKESPSAKPMDQPAQFKGYAIQVNAMRSYELAEAFVQEQKKSGQALYLGKVDLGKRGIWYRIYLGQFTGRAEAARFMREKKIKEIFPYSFIQKVPS